MSLGWTKVVNMLDSHVSNYIPRTLRQNNTLFVTNMLPWLHDGISEIATRHFPAGGCGARTNLVRHNFPYLLNSNFN